MDSNIITDKRSVIEMNNIIEFCNRLVLKDSDKAEAAETSVSLNNGYKFLNAMLKSDTLDSYEITRSDLLELKNLNDQYGFFDSVNFNPYLINLKKIPNEYKGYLLELKRFQFYRKYMKDGEKNSYYKEIFDLYISNNEMIISKFIDFLNNNQLPFYAAVRLFPNFSILYTPNEILSSTEIRKFKECFTRAQNYFLKVCYNQAYKIGNPKYNNVCQLIIIWLAIEQYLNSRLENLDDIDFFDEYSIRNMFLSYGLDYFFDFPLMYQRRVLKNINFLIKNKGNTKAIINVLNIFGFENIKVMKYVLTKQYPVDEEGKVDLDNPELKFYALDSSIMDIEKALTNKDAIKEYDYDEYVATDKYWQLTPAEKRQLLTEGYSYIYSKYISIDSFIDMAKAGVNMSYFANLLMEVEKEYQSINAGKNSLQFYDYKISQKPINVFNALLTMYSLVADMYNVEDNIIKEPTSLAKVYGYNFDNLIDDIQYFTTKYVTENMTDKEYKHYTDLLLKYNLERNFYDEYHTIKNYKYKYRNGEISKEEYSNIIRAYKYPDDLCKLLEQYLIGNVDEEIVKITFLENNIDYDKGLFQYISYVFLTEDINNDKYEALLRRYSLDKNVTLANYFIKMYLNDEINDTELEKYLEKFEVNLDETNINIDEVKSIKYIHNNNEITQTQYETFMNNYIVDDEDAYNYTKTYIDGKLTNRDYHLLIRGLGLKPDEILFNFISYKYLEDEISEYTYKNNIDVYNLNEDNIQDIDYIILQKNLYKAGKLTLDEYNQYRDTFKIDEATEQKILDYRKGDISEAAYNYYMVTNDLDIKYTEFKYLTYNFLNVDFVEQNYDSYISMYELDTSKAEAVKKYKNIYYNGKLSDTQYNNYKNKFNQECKYIYTSNRFLNDNTVDIYKKENMEYIEYTTNMTLSKFTKLYLNNTNFREELEYDLLHEKDYKTYRKLKALYECCCLANYRAELFKDKMTYSEYIKDRDSYLYTYIKAAKNKATINPDEKNSIYSEYILQLASSIETYLNNDKFNFLVQSNTIINDYIKTFVYQMIDFIKSYTIQIKDINTVLTFDDRFLNTILLFDDTDNFGGYSEDSLAELILHLYDKVGFDNKLLMTPDFFEKFEDMLIYKNKLNFSDDTGIRDAMNNKPYQYPYNPNEPYDPNNPDTPPYDPEDPDNPDNPDNPYYPHGPEFEEWTTFVTNFQFADLLLAIKDSIYSIENKYVLADMLNTPKDSLMFSSPLPDMKDYIVLVFKFIYDKCLVLSDLILHNYDRNEVINKYVVADMMDISKDNVKLNPIFNLKNNDIINITDGFDNHNEITQTDLFKLHESLTLENISNYENDISEFNEYENILYLNELRPFCLIYENLTTIVFDLNKLFGSYINIENYEPNINDIGIVDSYITINGDIYTDFNYENGILTLDTTNKKEINCIKLINSKIKIKKGE